MISINLFEKDVVEYCTYCSVVPQDHWDDQRTRNRQNRKWITNKECSTSNKLVTVFGISIVKGRR